MSPGLREADECKTRLAMQMIDVGIGMSEPECAKWVRNYLLAATAIQMVITLLEFAGQRRWICFQNSRAVA